MVETLDIAMVVIVGIVFLLLLYFYTILAFLFLFLIAIIFIISNMKMKKELKKLQEGYDAKEDKSRPVGKFRECIRTSEGDNPGASPEVIATEPAVVTAKPVPTGDVEPKRREVLPDATVVSVREPKQQPRTDTVGIKKSKGTLRNLFKRR